MKSSAQIQNNINKKAYDSPWIVKSYQSETLTRMETFALLKYQPYFANQNVLDIGVGTGRTSLYLAPLAKRYEGIDYSSVMVKYLKLKLPTVSTHQMDMRDLAYFTNESFDFVFGSNNVIDAIGHNDRSVTLKEIYRILQKDGIFMFSSHNFCYKNAGKFPKLAFSRNPVTQFLNLIAWISKLRSHSRMRRFQVLEKNYALLPGSGDGYDHLHYYINPLFQCDQLNDLGFEMQDIFDVNGKILLQGDLAIHSPLLMYVAKKI
jgi:ubiquinone/menaquinone biosynthesis C-methylase UbiE